MYIKTAQGWRELPIRAIPAPRDPSLLDIYGISPEDTSQQYANAIDAYLQRRISWERCQAIMGAKHPLPNGGLP